MFTLNSEKGANRWAMEPNEVMIGSLIAAPVR
jgi:hypothetical protein